MCCSLKTHVIVISSISLIFTGFTALSRANELIFLIFHKNDTASAIGRGILILIVFLITSKVLSIVGSFKNKKCLLIPFMISLVLNWFFELNFIGLGIYHGMLYPHFPYDANDLLCYSIGFGLTTYFLVIVVQFYKELTARARLQPEMVLQPYVMTYTEPAIDRPSTARVTTNPQTMTC